MCVFYCTIGTSNWSEEYFRTTAGVGLVIAPKAQNQSTPAGSFQQQLKAVFLRDWDSPFTVALNELHKHPDCNVWNLDSRETTFCGLSSHNALFFI